MALHRERRAGELVRQLIGDDQVAACHDVSDGGVLVAVAEMALAGNVGAVLEQPHVPHVAAWCFGEDQGRYLLEVRQDVLASVLEEAVAHDVSARVIGQTGGLSIAVGSASVALSELRTLHEGWLPAYMGNDIA